MIIHRFCSRAEYEAYRRGEDLSNNTDHYRNGFGGSRSIGFCFFKGDINAWAHRLNGLVDFDVLMSFEVDPQDVISSDGYYAVPVADADGYLWHRALFPEFSCQIYNNKLFRLVDVDFSYSTNPDFTSNSKLKELLYGI